MEIKKNIIIDNLEYLFSYEEAVEIFGQGRKTVTMGTLKLLFDRFDLVNFMNVHTITDDEYDKYFKKDFDTYGLEYIEDVIKGTNDDND